MFGLLHSNMDWLFAGTIVVIGLIVMIIKIMRGHIFTAAAGLTVWVFVFWLHKGSTTGIMTATFAALLFDTVGIFIISLFTGRKS